MRKVGIAAVEGARDCGLVRQTRRMDVMRGHDAGTADPQGSLLGVDSRLAPLLEGEESSFCARLAARGGVVICDQDIVDCSWSGMGRPSIPPCTAHMHFNGASASSTVCRVVTGVSEDGFGSRPFRGPGPQAERVDRHIRCPSQHPQKEVRGRLGPAGGSQISER